MGKISKYNQEHVYSLKDFFTGLGENGDLKRFSSVAILDMLDKYAPGGKLNKLIATKEVNSVDFNIQPETLSSGNVSSGTITTLTDLSANWEPNQWVDTVVRIKRNGGNLRAKGSVNRAEGCHS